MILKSALILIWILIQSAMADYATDLKINRTYTEFMKQLEGFVRKTTIPSALQAYQSQGKSDPSQKEIKKYSSIEVQQLSSKMMAQIVSQYKPIAYKIIHDAGYNTRGNYYVFDSRSKQWHLPNMPAPSNPINGTEVNSKILSTELDNAFLSLMSTNSRLQKRFVNPFARLKPGRLLTPVSKSAKDFVEGLSHLPNNVKAEKIFEQLKKLGDDLTDQAAIDQKYLHKKMVNFQTKFLEEQQHSLTLIEANRNTKQWLSLSWDDVFKHKISKVIGTFLMGYGLISVFSDLFDADEASSSISNTDNKSNSLVSESSNPIVIPSTANNVAGNTPSRYNVRPVSSIDDVTPELFTPPKVEPVQIVSNPLNSDVTSPSGGLPKTITQNGITYYLDERNFRYYYVDSSTNKSVYYSA